MALPVSGSLSIKNAAGNDRSIAYCVDGNITGDKSLSTLLTSASGLAVPGGITDFYSYTGAKDVNLCTYYAYGGNNSYNYCCTCTYTDPAMTAGESYCLCLGWNLCNDFSNCNVSTYSCILITCNGATVLTCCISSSIFCTTGIFCKTVDSNDVIRILTRVYDYYNQDNGLRSQACINPATAGISGSFQRGTTCFNLCNHTP